MRKGRQMMCYPWYVAQIKTYDMWSYIYNIGRNLWSYSPDRPYDPPSLLYNGLKEE